MRFKPLATITLAAGLFGAAIYGVLSQPEDAKTGAYDKLFSARQITVEEAVLNIGKDYNIIVDNERVATVSGKDFKVFGGDRFDLETVDGTLVAFEEEDKRYLFKLNRSATVYDGDGHVLGYLAEERWNDLFKWGYIFHFYDEYKNEIGRSQKITNSSVFGNHTIKDNLGNIDYQIDKQINWKRGLLGSDKYVIRVNDSKDVPLESAILLTCIEDAIKDSEESKTSDSDE